MFAVPNNGKCPVKAYKVYAEKQPVEMKTDDAPFYLAVNNVKSVSGKPWFKKAPVGVNKFITLMKTMAQKAGLGANFKNHSGRKTMITPLCNRPGETRPGGLFCPPWWNFGLPGTWWFFKNSLVNLIPPWCRILVSLVRGAPLQEKITSLEFRSCFCYTKTF